MIVCEVDLTITIISWNTRDLLRGCLRSIEQAGAKRGVEIHVVDNASSDGSREMVERDFPQVRLIPNAENLGFARANNQSWQSARGRYWLLLNSDAEMRPGALDALIEFMDKHPQAGLASARLISVDGSPQHCAQSNPCVWRTLIESSRLHKLLPSKLRGRLWLGPYWSYDQTIPVGWTWGTVLIARREAVEQVGPLSEEFFMYGEDLEWCLRMQKHGWEIWYCHEAEVIHYGGQSSAQKWQDSQKQKIILDNCYKAIETHRGRGYVRLLKMATLVSLRIEQFIKRLKGQESAGVEALVDYHKASLKRLPS
ncbi:MAG: glycosyltransferase family 2 protein [Blastocatellales bacterium]